MIRSIGFMLALLVATPVQAQGDGAIGRESASGIPSPEAVLGHQPGVKTYRDGQVTQYLRTVAEQSDRVTYETIGYSHEGRPIDFFVVTSPDNHARLEDIRQQHLRLSKADASVAVGDDMPVVI
ncbi:hypothetical protein JCM17846_18790 [Iodidimonas nitroreducens]|uniref:Peptidase M14 domain-containing protein n=1 Tax=Iodidimonas nitroreducens TaxID=1236968 RepID=A0A5A7N8C1_9PROT|nr:hypothetical protein AQ1_00537 [alpha proteobacterium Q-1]GER04197.1 hypothetical protein JCM17846_18790 [Iodidimonas nitroreducens]